MTDASSDFERAVAGFLRLAGHDVVGETLIGHKKVDLLVETRLFGKTRRTAVECKHYARPLTQEQVTAVYANYLPLVESGAVDEVLLVTDVGLHPSAGALVRDSRHFAHQTFLELRNSILDTAGYLQALVNQYIYESDGLPEYYIPLQTQHGEDLEELVARWIQSDSSQPLAILASYGAGKTSFAVHLAAQLARAAIAEPLARVPIYLKLGDIADEQSLEGLLGKGLTGASLVRNYSFDAFMTLNRDGRFVIILDGFDEMKQTLSWDEFRYNLRHLNRLVVPNSRVMLLGRPTAFLSDEEHEFALHGIRAAGQQVIRDPDWPDYLEVTIASLSQDRIQQFLQRYLTYRWPSSSLPEEPSQVQQQVASLVQRVMDSAHLKDIGRRPVQLRMLAEVLPSYRGAVDELTIAVLYDQFIDRIIEREMEKHSRLRFSSQERRRFAQRIAWWMWTVRRGQVVSATGVPVELLEDFAQPGDDIEAIRRDLVAACFLDRRMGEALVFPHRSFLEFLVAQELIRRLESMSLPDVDDSLNDEVALFFRLSVGTQDTAILLEKLMNYRGTLSWRLIVTILKSPPAAKYLKRTNKWWCPWYPLLLCLGTALWKDPGTAPLITTDEIIARLGTAQDDGKYAAVMLLCLEMLAAVDSKQNVIEQGIVTLMGVGTVKALTEKMRASGKYDLSGAVVLGNRHDGRAIEHLWPDPNIARLIERISVASKGTALDLRATAHSIAEMTADYCGIREWFVGHRIRTRDVPLAYVATVRDPSTIARLKSYQYVVGGTTGSTSSGTTSTQESTPQAAEPDWNRPVLVDLWRIDFGPDVYIRIDPTTTVQYFLDQIFVKMSHSVKAHSYGATWQLIDQDSDKAFPAMGASWARKHMHDNEDRRTVSTVGIEPGMRLNAVRIAP